MRKLTYLIVAFAICAITFSCRTKYVHVPVERISTEYRDRFIRDSIVSLDSVFVDRWRSNDTVYITKDKFKYLYRDKLVRDTINRTDSIHVPYPVTEYKEVNKLSSFQSFQLWCGRILLLLLLSYFGVKGLKRFR